MADEHLATYLNDHLAGAVAAIELLEHLEAAHRGTAAERTLSELRADVAADRQALETLMERLHVKPSRPRKAVAWLSERITELKLRLDDPAGGALRLLESLEAVAIGIHGKLALWRALAAAADGAPRLREADYERLAQRAEHQRSRLEVLRLDAAKTALGAAS
jgi:hypothetical protein